MDCTIIKSERIGRWCILVKLIVIWKEGKRWILNHWVIWRDGIFDFGCSGLMLVNKMEQLLLLHLVAAIIRLCPVMLVISDFGLAVVLIFFTSVFLAELLARCFSLFWKGQFDIKSFIIELMLLIPIGVFLYQMFVKGFTIGCKYNSPDFSIPAEHFERYFWNNFTVHLSDCVSNIFGNCSRLFRCSPLCLVFVIPSA